MLKLLILGSLIVNTKAFAAGAVYDPSKVVLKESPYKACKGIKFLTKKDYERRPDYWDQRCRKNGEKIQVLPDTSGLFFKLNNATSSLALLSAVGEKVIKKMNDNIAIQENLLNCFNGKTKSSECDKLTSSEIDKVYKLHSEMRQELALSEGEDVKIVGARRGNPGKIKYPEIKESINTSLKKSYLGTIGVYRPDGLEPLSLGESYQVQILMQQKLEEIKMSPELKSDKERVVVFEQVRAAHKARYLEIFQEAPVLTMLGKLPAKHNRQEINKAFTKSLEDLITFAKDEKDKILKKWSKASMATENKSKGDEGRASEILSFMSYQPIVDEVITEQIKENPLACAIAEELTSTMESEDLKKEIAVTGGIIGGAIALTALSGGAAALVLPEMVPVVGGMALSAQTAVAVALGPGIGFYSRRVSAKEMDASKASVAAGIKKGDDLDKSDGGIVAGNVTIGLDYLGIGLFKAAGESIFKAVAKKALIAEGLNSAEAEKLIQISQSTSVNSLKEAKEAQDRIKKSISSKVKSYFPNREPSKEELEVFGALEDLNGKKTETIKDFFERMEKIVDKNERKETLIQALKLIKLQNKEAIEKASPEALRDLNKQVVAIAKYGDIKDPAKIAAILSGWDSGAKGKLTSVFEEAKQVLDDVNFMKGKSPKERREGAFKSVLEKKKVTDSVKQQEMCTCSGVCSGGSVVLNDEVELLKIDKSSICVSSDKLTWYLL